MHSTLIVFYNLLNIFVELEFCEPGALLTDNYPSLHNQIIRHFINSSKKVRKLKFDWRFLSCYQLIFLAFGIIGKPCYSSLQWCAICYDYAIWGCAAHLNMGVGVKWNTFQSSKQKGMHCMTIAMQSFIFILESRWKFLMKELLICVRFSLNDGQSQVPSFDLNNDVFDLTFSPLTAK